MNNKSVTNALLLVVIGLFVIDFAWRLSPPLTTTVGHLISPAKSQESEGATVTNAVMDYPPFEIEKGRKRLYHVGVRVDDIDESIDFYVNKLGFKLSRTQDMGFLKLAFLWTGDGETQLELEEWRVEGQSLPPVGGLTHLGFFVDDVDAVYNKLAAEGVEWERETGPIWSRRPLWQLCPRSRWCSVGNLGKSDRQLHQLP